MAIVSERINSGHFNELEKELNSNTCPECGSRLIHDHHKLETSCSKCFLVVSESQFYDKDNGIHALREDGTVDTSHSFASDRMRTDKGRGTITSGSRMLTVKELMSIRQENSDASTTGLKYLHAPTGILSRHEA